MVDHEPEATEPDPPTPRGDLRQAAVRGAGWSLLQAWGGRIVSTASFFLLARLLAPDDFGVVALATIVVELGQKVMNRGFGAAIVQREEVTRDDLDAVFWFTLAVGTVLTSISWITAGFVADLVNEPTFAPVLRVLSINWMLSAFWAVPQNILQRDLRFASLTVRRLLAVSISGFVAVTMALAGAGVWSLVAMSLVQSVVSIVVLWTASSWRPGRHVSRASLVAMRGFAVRMVAIDVLRFFAVRGEGLLIGAVLGSVSLGYYAVAQRFTIFLNEVFTASIGQVAFPVFSRLQFEHERRLRALRSVIRLASLLAFPAFAGLIVLAPETVQVLLGDTWEPSVILVQILALHGLRTALSYFVSGVIVSTGDAALQLRVVVIGLCVKMVALVIGLQYDVEGVAWAVVISSYITLPLTFWALRKATGLTAWSYIRQTIEPALASAVMVAAILGFKWATEDLADLAVLVGGIAVGAVAYTLTILLIAPQLVDDVRNVLRDARGRRSSHQGDPDHTAQAEA